MSLLKQFQAILFLLFVTSCARLKEISTFSAASQKGLQDITIPYNYVQYSYDTAFVKNDTIRHLKQITADSATAVAEDTILKNKFAIIVSYYTALAKLSGNASINAAPLSKAVTKGKYGSVTVTEEEASAFGKISDITSKLITLNYRNNKVKNIIQGNGRFVDSLLTSTRRQLDDFRGKIANLRSSFEAATNLRLRHAASNDDARSTIFQFEQKRQQWDEAIHFYENLIHIIEKIEKGQQEIETNVDNFKSDSFKQNILSVVSDIIYLYSDQKK